MRIGVVGCGYVAAARHLPALRRVRAAEVLAAADVDRSRLTACAERFGIPRRYRDHLELVADADLDAVAVCAPTGTHVDVASAALAAGKHVFLEKPAALESGEARRLQEQLEESDRKLLVGFNLRWHRVVREIRRLVAEGALGRIELVRTTMADRFGVDHPVSAWREDRRLGGGALAELGSHHFDLWRFLLSDEVEEVEAVSRSELTDDQTAAVMARMRRGTVVSSTFSKLTGAENEIEIFGASARLTASLYRFDGLRVLPASGLRGDARDRLRGAVRLARSLPRAAWMSRRGGEYLDTYRAEWQHFVRAIRDDDPVGCSLEDGRRALEILLAAMEAARSGRAVRPADGRPRLATVGGSDDRR